MPSGCLCHFRLVCFCLLHVQPQSCLSSLPIVATAGDSRERRLGLSHCHLARFQRSNPKMPLRADKTVVLAAYLHVRQGCARFEEYTGEMRSMGINLEAYVDRRRLIVCTRLVCGHICYAEVRHLFSFPRFPQRLPALSGFPSSFPVFRQHSSSTGPWASKLLLVFLMLAVEIYILCFF